MILLDTHIWIWWLHADKKLTPFLRSILEKEERSGLKISMMSCWEVAKLAEFGKLKLEMSAKEWFSRAFAYPEIEILPLTLDVIIESTSLPGKFHRDPVDQIIVATSRILKIPLLTVDEKILNYDHVETIRNATKKVGEEAFPYGAEGKKGSKKEKGNVHPRSVKGSTREDTSSSNKKRQK